MATVEVIKVYADGTGDFTSLKTAIDTNKQNLVTNDKALYFECSGELANGSTYIDFGAFTTNRESGHDITIAAKAGEEATGIASAGTLYSSATYLFVLRDRHVTLRNLEFTNFKSEIHTASNLRAYYCYFHDAIGFISNTGASYYENCIFVNVGATNTASGYGIPTQNATMHRCTVIADTQHGGYRGEVLYRYNIVTQCLAFNATVGGYTNYLDCTNALNDYNADSEGKAPGTNTFTVSLADFVDPANNNYNLSPSSALYTAGPNGESVGAVLAVDLGGISVPVEISGETYLPSHSFQGSISPSIPQPSLTGSWNIPSIVVSGEVSSTKSPITVSGGLDLRIPKVIGEVVPSVPSPIIHGDLLIRHPLFNGIILTTLPSPSVDGSVYIGELHFEGSVATTQPTPQLTGSLKIPSQVFKGKIHSSSPQPSISGSLEIGGNRIYGSVIASKPFVEITANLKMGKLVFSGNVNTTQPSPSIRAAFNESPYIFSGRTEATYPQPYLYGSVQIEAPLFKGMVFIKGSFIQSTTNLVWLDVPDNIVIIEDVENSVTID